MPRYTVEVRKSLGAYAWANTWHIEASGRGAADQVGAGIAAFERALLASSCQVDDVKVSTWPNPSGIDFTIQTLEVAGQATLTNVEPAELCMLVAIASSLGRPGRKWLRMSLDETDVTQSAGKAVLVPGGGWSTRFTAARNALNTVMLDNSADFLIGSNPVTARTSLNVLQVLGCGFRDRDVGWYNRAP